MTAMQTEIESRLAGVEPEVEVLLVEVVSGSTLRLFIDHPGRRHAGAVRARLGPPERLPRALRARGVLARPGPPADQAPALHPLPRSPRARPPARADSDGHSSVTGELVGASERDVTIAADEGVVTIPYEQIARSNLVPGD